jgi:hypothetical protein
MGLFSFFRKSNVHTRLERKNSEDSNIAYIWHDDYRKTELISDDNKDFIKKLYDDRKNELNDFTVQQSLSFPTCDLEIRIDALEKLCKNHKLPKFEKIKSETKGLLEYDNSDIKAFGYFNFKLFFEVQNEFVKYIWIDLGLIVSVEQIQMIDDILYSLGEIFDLILVSWSSGEFIDLKNKKQISKYTRKMFK